MPIEPEPFGFNGTVTPVARASFLGTLIVEVSGALSATGVRESQPAAVGLETESTPVTALAVDGTFVSGSLGAQPVTWNVVPTLACIAP